MLLEEERINATKEEQKLLQAGKEVFLQLQEKYSDPIATKSQKKLILSSAPKSWSIRTTAEFFGATRYEADVMKKWVGEKGILFLPNPKTG